VTNVFLLWHISHLLREAGVQHLAEDGTPLCDEQAGDDPKLLSVYSSDERARAKITAARLLPGFRDEPACFQVVAYTLDHDKWPEGFVISG
jgi:hypothetical protein